jgi:hypothetical protein
MSAAWFVDCREFHPLNLVCVGRGASCRRCSVVWEWDLNPAPVCDRVAALLDSKMDKPLICLNAMNPKLFDIVSTWLSVRVGSAVTCSLEAAEG